MPDRLLFTNGTVISDTESRELDLLVEGERVLALGSDLDPAGAEEIDCTGRLLLPGGVDPHTHFDLPMFDTVSSDDHYTGHKAAAFGGTTTVMDFVPLGDGTLRESVDQWRDKARKAAIDYGFHMNITRWDEEIAREIPELPEMGITTLKMFMAYNGRLRLQDREIFEGMRAAAAHDLLVMLHAENGDVIDVLTEEARAQGRSTPIWHARTRPAWGAVDAVLRGCALAAQAGARLYVVHMNTAGGVDMLTYSRARGVRAMGETCPQYLFFTERDLSGPEGSKFVCSPPLRTEDDRAALHAALVDGRIQVIGTDHCPFFFDGTRALEYEGEPIKIPGKELGRADFTKIPNGLPAVGDRLPVIWSRFVETGQITPEHFVGLTSANPARIFGLYPRKGALEPGSDADIVVWNPERSLVHGAARSHHRTDYNLFEGWQLTGWPDQVFLRGRRIVEGSRWLGSAGQGRFLERIGGELL